MSDNTIAEFRKELEEAVALYRSQYGYGVEYLWAQHVAVTVAEFELSSQHQKEKERERT